MSHALAERGLDHLVLERNAIGERWRSERWDSLAFQFPNWSLRLPGLDYTGTEPEAFASQVDVRNRILEYAAVCRAPVRTGVEVQSLRAAGAGFQALTSNGVVTARNVVLATGPFQAPRVPGFARKISPGVLQLHSSRYRNPAQLPPGPILVVGSGGSGGQIAEELAESGRTVYLALSRHRRVPRRRHGHDVLWWLFELGWADRQATDNSDGRTPPTLLLTGVHGGHDLDLRRLQSEGVVLLGRLRGGDGCVLNFHDDANAIVDSADEGFRELVAAIDERAQAKGIELGRDEAEPSVATSAEGLGAVDLEAAGINSIVWCTGYAFDYSWVHVPCFANGTPVQRRGVSGQPGLYFLGLHWMHTFKSGTFFGVGEDAAYVADQVRRRR
jgi:putative flavoprotein involved in K+ transport